jgi:hypothetical protein
MLMKMINPSVPLTPAAQGMVNNASICLPFTPLTQGTVVHDASSSFDRRGWAQRLDVGQ